jgi:heterodisulfide reductase subunit B
MEGSARAYSQSLDKILGPLGMELEEVHDWNCCGATEYLSINLIPAYSLIARNLALAAKQIDGNNELLAPCSACYLNLEKADYYMAERPALGKKVNEALAAGGLHYDPGTLQIRHLVDALINDVGLDTIKSKVVRPLTGLRIAPYLGCMVPRPDYAKRWSDHEHPSELDDLMKALGADVIEFPMKTSCCGGHMTQIGPDTAYELIRRLVSEAEEIGADIMVTVCPMCQMNLDAYQAETNRHFHTNYKMPIIFFTQLMGIAFGKDPKAMGFGKELVDTRPALAKIGVELPVEAPPPAKRQKKTGLPMPVMPGQEEVEQ